MRGKLILLVLICLPISGAARALTIRIDYTFDSNLFFTAAGNPQGAVGAIQAKASLEAAAARWSAIIDQSLGAVNLMDDNDDPRIRVSHPATGKPWQISSATSAATDSLVQEGGKNAANEYRGPWNIPADTWLLYTGAHNISPSAGFGGTESGTNWNEVINDPNGINNRGFTAPPPAGTQGLPVWGGWVVFNNAPTIAWHFDHNAAPPVGKTDFYTIALHEIGHALGLHSGYWTEWLANVNGSKYNGTAALAAYNADNGSNLSSLTLDELDHWANDRYHSKIFASGSPNYVGTVGAGALQGLLMESRLPQGIRFELTNADVGAIADLGWSVISQIVVEPNAAVDLSVQMRVDGAVQLSWSGLAGTIYTVQTSRDLVRWIDERPITASSTKAVWLDSKPSPGGIKYYRVVSN